MYRFVFAEWLRMRRLRLTWVLLALLLGILALQVNGMLSELEGLKTEVETGISLSDDTPLSPNQIEGNLFLIELREKDLRYPAFIGTVARLSTGFGWFFVILFTVVFGGEDFNRRTLPVILARGVRRRDYLIARILALWLAMGMAVVIIMVLASACGPYVHMQVTDDPISLIGLGDALLWVLRSWLTCLPFIVAVLFWAVLARNMGPALGVGIGLHTLEYLYGLVIPFLAVVSASADLIGGDVPLIYRLQIKLFSITLGYNADLFLYWGAPYMRDPIFVAQTLGLNDVSLMPTTPTYALALLSGYTVLFFGLTLWLLQRRDVTYGP
ncbi:MAG TPA: ABC transporter permease subunit [Anaerolineae bacterium]|nr:ABC transporter permease subunit [Anaerolineae bacterium]